jgi:hypothetical protein
MASEPGRALVLIGLVIVAIGLYLVAGGKLDFLGRLPGDLRIEKENFTLFFPVGTCLLISVLLSLLAWFFKR